MAEKFGYVVSVRTPNKVHVVQGSAVFVNEETGEVTVTGDIRRLLRRWFGRRGY